jgi:hypothetical protein
MQVKGLQTEYNRLLDSSGGAEGQNAAVQVRRAAFCVQSHPAGCEVGCQSRMLAETSLSRPLRCTVAAATCAIRAVAPSTAQLLW